MQYRAILILSPTATANITAYRFVSPAGAVPTAGGNTMGVANSDTLSGKDIPLIAIGTAIVECGGTIAAMGLVETDNTGKAIALDSGKVAGRALQAGAAGRKIEILLFQNS
jgi:hypothetical protein